MAVEAKDRRIGPLVRFRVLVHANNDAALELCSAATGANAGRLKSLCQVPLQDTDLACRELTRCLRAGHIGVQIGNHVQPYLGGALVFAAALGHQRKIAARLRAEFRRQANRQGLRARGMRAIGVTAPLQES